MTQAAVIPGDVPGFADVDQLLAPSSIAVVGASEREGNLGGVAVGLLAKFGFPGQIWPVHPSGRSVAGLSCFRSVADLPAPADVAILAVPAAACAQLVRACAAAGIGAGIIWSGGFAEVGPQGRELQDELVAACRDVGFALLGPNCLGVIDSYLPVTMTFASFLREIDELPTGEISMVSQSGGLATMTQAMAARRGFGFRYMVSSGNEAVVGISDILHALARDPSTQVVVAYLEGVRDGAAFVTAVGEMRDAGKPLVVLKAGATSASAAAAAAHTGAMVGEERVWTAVLDEFGTIQVWSLDELLDVAIELTSTAPAKLPRGRGLAAVTFGGGMGVLAADQAARRGLTLPTLAPETQERLRPLVPPAAAVANPVDLTPQSYLDPTWLPHLPAALDVIAADPQIDSILVQAGPMATGSVDVAETVAGLRDRTDNKVSLAWPLAPQEARELLSSRGVHVFQESARAIDTLAKLAVYQSRTKRSRPPVPLSFDWSGHLPAPRPGQVVSEQEVHGLLSAAALPVARATLVQSADDAVAAVLAISLPVAMKGISPEVTHRAAAGLVALGVASTDEVRARYRSLHKRANDCGVRLAGIYVQEMIAGGFEVLVSAFRDRVFGPMVSVAAGGTMAEAIDEVALLRAPLGLEDAATMLTGLGRADLIPSPDDPAHGHLTRFISAFSRLAASAPWEEFVLEINPVIASRDGACAVDGLLLITEP